eukprot:g7860.t1
MKLGGASLVSEKVDMNSDRDFRIVNLYHLVDIPDPEQVVELHRGWMMGHDIKGRIYFSNQGINAQFTGPVFDTEQYLHWMKRQPWFQELKWNSDPVHEHMFPKLRLKVKPNLVQLNGGISSLPITRASSRAIPLNPSEWKNQISAALQTNDNSAQKAVILDVRNGYEWDAGHFEGAFRPKEDSFAETPVQEDIPDPLKSTTDKSTPIYMYCTGGIRCDIYSTVLRRRGFQNLYTLEGGVQRYFKEQGSKFWNGSLFVFDGRMAISVDGSQKELPSSIKCQICGNEAQVPHVNCANIDCNRLFIACAECKTLLKGCCSKECTEAPRLLRPMKLNGDFYGKFGTYTMGRLKKSMKEGEVRREAKRHRRLERLRKKRELLNEAKIKMKRMIRDETKRRIDENESSTSKSLREALQELSSQ